MFYNRAFLSSKKQTLYYFTMNYLQTLYLTRNQVKRLIKGEVIRVAFSINCTNQVGDSIAVHDITTKKKLNDVMVFVVAISKPAIFEIKSNHIILLIASLSVFDYID